MTHPSISLSEPDAHTYGYREDEEYAHLPEAVNSQAHLAPMAKEDNTDWCEDNPNEHCYDSVGVDHIFAKCFSSRIRLLGGRERFYN